MDYFIRKCQLRFWHSGGKLSLSERRKPAGSDNIELYTYFLLISSFYVVSRNQKGDWKEDDDGSIFDLQAKSAQEKLLKDECSFEKLPTLDGDAEDDEKSARLILHLGVLLHRKRQNFCTLVQNKRNIKMHLLTMIRFLPNGCRRTNVL